MIFHYPLIIKNFQILSIKIIKNKAFGYILSLSVGKSCQLISKFILSITVARVLGPSQFGFWSMIELINKYSPLLTLGVSNGVKRELPYWNGKKVVDKQKMTEMTGYTSMLLSLTLFVLLGGISFFIIEGKIAKFAIMATFISGGLYQLYLYIYSTQLAKKLFYNATKINVIEGILILLITVSLVYKYGFSGLLIGNIMVPLSISIFLLNKYKIINHLKFDYIVFRKILSIGLPILLVGMGHVFLLTVNRLIIPIYYSVEMVGYFSFAMLFLTLFSPLFSSLSEVLYTYMNEHVGSKGRVDNMDHVSIYPGLLMSIVIPTLVIPIILLVPWGITNYYPAYIESIPSAKFVLVLVAITGGGGVNILSSIQKQNLMLLFILLSIIINVVLCNYFLMNGYGLEWSIIAIIIGVMFYKVLNTVASLIIMKKSFKTYLLIIIAFIYSAGISFLTIYKFDKAIQYPHITIAIPFAVVCLSILFLSKSKAIDLISYIERK